MSRWYVGLLALGITALPILLLSPFPTQDGPSHLYAGHVLRHLGDPAYPSLNDAFEYSASATSTWTVHGVIALLLDVVSPFWVEKILVLAFVLLLFAVFSTGTAELLLFPVCALPLFAMSFPLRMGFHSFCLSMPLALLAVALWTGVAGVRRRLVVAACLVAVLPLLHLLATAWALALMGAGSIAWMASSRRVEWRELVILGAASLPLLALVFGFPGSSGFVWQPLGVRLAALMAGGAIVGVGPYALWWSSVPSLVLLGLGLLFLRGGAGASHPKGTGLCRVILAATALVVALVAPEEGAGGAYVGVRYNLLFFLLLLYLLRTWNLPRRADTVLATVFLVLSALHLGRMYSALEPASAAAREIASSAAALENHTSLLVVVAGEWIDSGLTLDSQVRPILHAGEMLGIGADRTVLTFYEGDLPYFPVNFRPEANPFEVLFDRVFFDWGEPEVRWDLLPTWRGGVDYVAVWEEGYLLRSSFAESFGLVLRGRYKEVYRSADLPWVIYGLDGDRVR